MRIDLPLCDLKTCRYCFDGNCTDNIRHSQCPYKNPWMPVSEINNARNGELLVTRKYISGNYLDIVTKTTMNSDMVASDILAWTYLPEPYQEQEDEQ